MCIAVLSLREDQRTGVNLHGRNSDHAAVDGMSSGLCSLIREVVQSPITAGHSRQTCRVTDETAAQSWLTAGKPDSGTLTVGRRQFTDTAVASSLLDASRLTTPALFAGGSVDEMPCMSDVQHSVTLNGISNVSKSADTCTGTCHYDHYHVVHRVE